VVPIRADLALRPSAADLIDAFTARYRNRATARKHRGQLTALFAATGRTHPSQLTETDILTWCGSAGLSNNTVRNRLSGVCTFLRWAARNGHADPALADALASRDNPLKHSTPRLYGKVQATHPARWLTHDQAYTQLLATCDTATDVGLRDAIILRLGLSGMRVNEISNLTIRSLLLRNDPPEISWTGKGNRARRFVPGPALTGLLNRYLVVYEQHLGRSLQANDALLCRRVSGPTNGGLDWGRPLANTNKIRNLVAAHARTAGLGHLAPHDLRRSAAGILHRATGSDGGHLFDLLDIQQVLGHADPATTMRSYLEPLNTAVQVRAATILD
jgi:integrase